jgi:lipopolysaccharide exporter
MPVEPLEQGAPTHDAPSTSVPENPTLLKLRQSLLRTFLGGFSWAAAARVLAAIGTVARYVIFVRLLKPFDFGVIGSATAVCAALLAATDPVMQQALIQQKDAIDPYLDTLLTTYLVRGLIIGGMLFLFAHPLGTFFHLGAAYTVFWAMAPLPVLQAIQSPRVVSLHRQLDFHLVMILNVAEVAASLVLGLAAVLFWRDWRGLVFSVLVGAAARDLLTYWLFPYWPRLRFSLARAKEMLSFGLWFSFGTLCDFVARQLDNLVIGHLMGPGALGNYQMALRAGEMPVAEFTMSAFVVTFPMVAQLREYRRGRARLLRAVTALVAVIGIAYAAFVFAFGERLVLWLFGPAWVQAINPLKVLCIYGLLQGFLTIGRSFLSGLGRPDRYVISAATRACVLAIVIYPLTTWHGPTGAAVAGVISIVAALPVMSYLLLRME